MNLRCSPSPEGEGETLSEYICDWPNWPHVAEHVLGAIRELRAFVAVCSDHLPVTAKAISLPETGAVRPVVGALQVLAIHRAQ